MKQIKTPPDGSGGVSFFDAKSLTAFARVCLLGGATASRTIGRYGSSRSWRASDSRSLLIGRSFLAGTTAHNKECRANNC